MESFGSEIEFLQSPSGPFGYAHDAFRCHFPGCNASYRRKEHLSRHETTKHAQRQEFVCSTCGREFGRSDTLRRHVQRQHKIIEPLHRASRACASCHAGKTRCEGGVPCEECVRRDIQCSFQDNNGAAKGQIERPSVPNDSPAADDQQELNLFERKRRGIDLYFERFHPHWPFVHKGSFNVHRENPLLLQSMVALGMWVLGEQPAQSAAVELHNKLDSALRDQREKWDASEVEGVGSTCLWPIATYQAILLHIIFSVVMKAGDAVNLNLKASISTADTELLKSLVGSCRRLGMFSYPNMLAKFKEADIPSFVWVCTEEVKRFIIALYKFCTKLNSSDSGEPPLLSASELDFPLPSNDALWHSIGKHEWEANAKDQNTVSLTDDLQAKWISNFADVLEFLGL